MLLFSKTLFARRAPVDREAWIAGCEGSGGVRSEGPVAGTGEYITKAMDRGDSEEIDGRGNCDNGCLLRESRDFVAAHSPWNPRLPLSPVLVTYWEPINSAKMLTCWQWLARFSHKPTRSREPVLTQKA